MVVRCQLRGRKIPGSKPDFTEDPSCFGPGANVVVLERSVEFISLFVNRPCFISMMNSTKSKSKFVPLKVKLEALKRLDKGETLKKLAAEYGVVEVTVGDWRRNRSKLEAFPTNKCSDLSLDRKSLKKSEFEKTGEALYMWLHSKGKRMPSLESDSSRKRFAVSKRI
ncbi:hypothetical protein AVEN_163162-1 [Araneus ventricosus]|uniref:HTH psq-type domain-containing protein n=1 Tax=Araneus ventricosus TaxID=182803 RepID=A0A4Y2DJH7_ARAVE|nr:hypothetical protein AVEN_163162-1 [Araneus ventricosus]